ncbi:head-tail adaptor protein [Streptomyces shenzhenensis]|uniref:head-tail adaptor protein n=1 Tax=Streptomyces shenzhenensis TaxID=943815 RepID=UPI003D8E3FEC
MTGPITHLFNRRLQVRRPSTADDGYGGQSGDLVTQPGTVAAKVDQPSAAERALAAQTDSRHTHTVYLQPAADVRYGDVLRDPATGEQWRVTAVVGPSTPVYRKAEAELMQTEGEPSNG